ncbi:hypothetical protein M3F63_00065 [Brachybacterium muris]|nr:hypothetical protein [Brachybacterium muris]MCT2176075.1 hypothetical protein [Brachybacterium muris]
MSSTAKPSRRNSGFHALCAVAGELGEQRTANLTELVEYSRAHNLGAEGAAAVARAAEMGGVGDGERHRWRRCRGDVRDDGAFVGHLHCLSGCDTTQHIG